MEMLLWLPLVAQLGPGFANCWWIFHFFAVCAIRRFSSLVLIHRCLLEHSLHVQIYIVHCASGAVAGLCVNVDRGLNGTWRLRFGEMNCWNNNKPEGEIILNEPEPRLLSKSSFFTLLVHSRLNHHHYISVFQPEKRWWQLSFLCAIRGGMQIIMYYIIF